MTSANCPDSIKLEPAEAEAIESTDPSSATPDEPAWLSTLADEIPDLLQTLAAANESLQQGFERLERGFDSKIKYDTSKEKIIDALHRELQAYRDGLHFKILRPVFADLISMYDDLSSLARHPMTQEEAVESEERLGRSLSTFQDTIKEILYRNGVQMYREEGNHFVAQRQRAVRIVETDDPQKDRLVAEHVREGFEYDGKVLRPEMVATYRYVAPKTDLVENDA